VMPCSLVQG